MNFSSTVKSWGKWMPGIIVLVIIVYIPLFENDFLKTWDDNRYILENQHLRELNIKNIGQLFTLYYDGHYHPLTLLSLGIDYQFFGLNPVGFHATNLILHLLNTFLVFLFLYLLLGRKNITIPLISSLLFGISTMHVESVAWASERKNLLFAFFYLTSLIAYTTYCKSGKGWKYFLALGLFILSLFSKAMALPLVFILFLIDYYYERRLFSRKVLIEKIPFLIIAIIFGLISIVAQKATWGEDLSQEHHTLFYRILFSGYAFSAYILKLVVPYKMSGFYPYPKEISLFTMAVYGLFVLIIAGIIYLSFRLRKKFVILVFGFLFFSLNIFPLLKIFEVPAGDYVLADRYAYIASIGIFLILAYGYLQLTKISPFYRNIAIVFLTVYVIFISLQTFNRLSVWQNDIVFYSDIINKYPEAELAYTNRGSLFKESHKYQKALRDFNKVIDLGKKDYKTFANRGAVYSDLGQYEKAVADFENAVQLNGNQPDILASYGFVLLNTGQHQKSIEILTRSLQIRGNNPEAHTNRGTAWFSLGRFDKAIEDYLVASEQDPGYIQAHFNRGLARINSGELEDAISDFLKAIKINPNHYESYSNMGVAWSKLGNFDKAFENYKNALNIKPDYYEALLNRGVDKFYLADFEGARIDLTKSLEINPNLAPAYYFRGMILRDTDRQASCSDMNMAVSLGFSAAVPFVNNYCK